MKSCFSASLPVPKPPISKALALAVCLFCCLAALAGCQPMTASLHSEGGPDSQDGFGRDGLEAFQDRFLSNRLDLVIVMDSRPGMREILKTNLFGEAFLDQFSDYDWRLAHTGSSVNKALFSKKESKDGDEGCSWLGGLSMGALGWVTTSPILVAFGYNSISSCIFSDNDSSEDKPENSDAPPVNGVFLPFERQNKKWRDGLISLSGDEPDYNRIFNDTMTLSDSKKPGFFSFKRKKEFYEAPIEQGGDSLPLLAIMLSLSKPSHQQHFFRDSSQIIYVAVAPADISRKFSGRALRKAVGQVFGRKDRFQLIPVSIPSGDLPCQMRFQEAGVEGAAPALKLKKLARELGNKGVSICSPNLGEDLADEIKKYLRPPDLLQQAALQRAGRKQPAKGQAAPKG